MVHLTPEERERIYEEEKARHEAQERIKRESPEGQRKEAKKQIAGGCLQIIIGLILLGIGGFCLLSLFIK